MTDPRRTGFSRHDPRLAVVGAGCPRLRAIYAHPVGCEGGFLPDDAIVLDFDPEAMDAEIQAALAAIAEAFRKAAHRTIEWSLERSFDVEKRVGPMRIDLYVRK